jgi:hypothetical protein
MQRRTIAATRIAYWFDDFAMRRWVPIPLACLALLAGCGSSDDQTTRSATAKASSASAPAELVARTFLGAAIGGPGSVACSLMTPNAVARLAAYVQSTSHNGGGRLDDCAEYFVAYQTSGGGTYGSYKIGQVSVSGSTARATVLCPPCDHGPFSPHPLRLRKTASGWRVDFDYRKGY